VRGDCGDVLKQVDATQPSIVLGAADAKGNDLTDVTVELDGKRIPRGNGNALSAAKWRVLQEQTFFGNDVDPKMVRLATMNLTLRGLPNVRIRQRNVLTTAQDAERKAELPYFPGKFMTGADYAREYLIPNFFFHVAMVYAIMRNAGVPLGKNDFLGSLPLQDNA
jgi:hypothetical protein